MFLITQTYHCKYSDISYFKKAFRVGIFMIIQTIWLIKLTIFFKQNITFKLHYDKDGLQKMKQPFEMNINSP